MSKDKKTLHDHLVIIHNLLFIGCTVTLLSLFFQSSAFSWGLLAIGILIMVSGVLYRNKHYKCPHCCRILNVLDIPKFCPNCGKELK